MAGEPTPTTRAYPYAVLGLTLLVFAAALLVSGIQLLTTCETVTQTGPFTTAIVCVYPFQEYGATFLYAAGLLLLVSAGLLQIGGSSLREKEGTLGRPSSAGVLLLVAFLLTAAYILASLAL